MGTRSALSSRGGAVLSSDLETVSHSSMLVGDDADH